MLWFSSLLKLAAFSQLQFSDGKPMVNTYRPLQPLNGRVVYYSGGNIALMSTVLLMLSVLISCSLSLHTSGWELCFSINSSVCVYWWSSNTWEYKMLHIKRKIMSRYVWIHWMHYMQFYDKKKGKFNSVCKCLSSLFVLFFFILNVDLIFSCGLSILIINNLYFFSFLQQTALKCTNQLLWLLIAKLAGMMTNHHLQLRGLLVDVVMLAFMMCCQDAITCKFVVFSSLPADVWTLSCISSWTFSLFLVSYLNDGTRAQHVGCVKVGSDFKLFF